MKTLSIGILGFAFIASAQASVSYTLSITNGSAMPLSPAAVYVKKGTDRMVGVKPPAGFVSICEKGDAQARVNELKMDPQVSSAETVAGPILPGETRKIIIKVKNPAQTQIHFETMYGKTKDICGVIDVDSHDLLTLKHQPDLKLNGKDDVVGSGFFLQPRISADSREVCAQLDAISCLRKLAPSNPKPQVTHFRPYLPSLLNLLEDLYGADEVDTLLIPTSGAISFTLSLN